MSEAHVSRAYPARPLVGVGAVILRGGKVLLEQRGQPPAQGAWSIPGGLIELGETAEQAITREVFEETGLHIRVGPVIGLFEPIERDAEAQVRYHFVVIDFLAYYESGELQAGDDAADVCWAHPADLTTYQLTPATREMIERGLRMAMRALE